jgi:hypothetical protein
MVLVYGLPDVPGEENEASIYGSVKERAKGYVEDFSWDYFPTGTDRRT